MTTFTVPPAGSPAWREIYLTPPDVRVGRWCPIDDHELRIRLDGWGCPRCAAAWDFHGLAGRWLADTAAAMATAAPAVRWRPSAVAVLAGGAGCAAAADALVAVLGGLDQRLLWWLSAAIAAAAVLYVAAGWLSRQIADRLYRHNRVIATYDSVEQALGGPEVSDEH
jgi:hypothetical protein